MGVFMKRFIIAILLNFTFSFSSAQADTSDETPLQLRNVERAIWKNIQF